MPNEAIIEMMRRQGIPVQVDPVTGETIVAGSPTQITGVPGEGQGVWEMAPPGPQELGMGDFPTPPPQTPLEQADAYNPLAFVQQLRERVEGKQKGIREDVEGKYAGMREKATAGQEVLRGRLGEIGEEYEGKITEARREEELGMFVHTLSDSLARYGALAMTGVGAMKAGLRPRDFYVEPQAGKLMMNMARQKRAELTAARKEKVGMEVTLSNQELATQLGIDQQEANTLLNLSEAEMDNIFKFGQAEMNALVELQKMSPESARSSRMREFVQGIYPEAAEKLKASLDNMNFEEIASVFPALKDKEEQKWRSEEKKLDREIKQATLEFRKAEKERIQGRLPNKAVDELRDLKGTLDGIKRVKELYKVAAASTGPFIGRVNNLLQKIGVATDDGEFTKLSSELGGILASYMKSISGAAISEPEAKRLAALMPRTGVTPTMFKALIERFEQDVKQRYNNTIDMYERQGRVVEQFRLPGEVTDSGNKIQVRHKATGEVREATQEMWDNTPEAERQNFELIDTLREQQATRTPVYGMR